MLLYYVAQNQHSLATFLNFVARWLLYSIASPSLDATYYARSDYAGDFGPEVSPLSYLSSPASAGLIVVFGAIVAACLLPRYRGKGVGAPPDIMLALAAYALVRASFFFAVFPYECLLVSSSTTLAHLLLIGIPFCASTFPCKRGLLAAAAALLFITNGWFMIGQ